jgi:hypothetical protein
MSMATTVAPLHCRADWVPSTAEFSPRCEPRRANVNFAQHLVCQFGSFAHAVWAGRNVEPDEFTDRNCRRLRAQFLFDCPQKSVAGLVQESVTEDRFGEPSVAQYRRIKCLVYSMPKLKLPLKACEPAR